MQTSALSSRPRHIIADRTHDGKKPVESGSSALTLADTGSAFRAGAYQPYPRVLRTACGRGFGRGLFLCFHGSFLCLKIKGYVLPEGVPKIRNAQGQMVLERIQKKEERKKEEKEGASSPLMPPPRLDQHRGNDDRALHHEPDMVGDVVDAEDVHDVADDQNPK